MRYDRYPMDERMDYADSRYDYSNGPMHFESDRRYDAYPRMDERRRRSSTTGRYVRDRHMTGEEKLPEEDIERWTKSLLSEMEERDRQQLKMDAVMKRAQDMGIAFEKFTPEEFYVTVVMLHTDFSKALPAQPIDTYIKMAKAWLCDPDAAKRYGKKLAAYYEEIVNGDD
jgi:hypothetical protein